MTKALFFILIGCAFSTISGQLRFQDRELVIHPDKPVLAYPYIDEECHERKKPFKFLGKILDIIQKI